MSLIIDGSSWSDVLLDAQERADKAVVVGQNTPAVWRVGESFDPAQNYTAVVTERAAYGGSPAEVRAKLTTLFQSISDPVERLQKWQETRHSSHGNAFHWNRLLDAAQQYAEVTFVNFGDPSVISNCPYAQDLCWREMPLFYSVMFSSERARQPRFQLL